jgi:hypothetical protein
MSTFTITKLETLRRKILILSCFIMLLLVTVNAKAQNIGIGTATPLAKLHVGGGNVLIDQNLQVNGNGLFLQKFMVGVVIGEPDHKLRVIGGKTWTSKKLIISRLCSRQTAFDPFDLPVMIRFMFYYMEPFTIIICRAPTPAGICF